MTYTGQTQVGSPPQSRDLGSVTLTKLAVGALDNNVYLLRSADGASLLIDAAADADAIMGLLPDGHLDAVLTTHCHQDHWQALADIVDRTGAITLAGATDADAIGVATDRRLRHGDTYALGSVLLDIIELRGHTPGSIAVHLPDTDGGHHLITGDSLFPGGVGRTTPDTFDQLLDDVESRIFEEYDDAWVYPGHGWDTTLGAERPHLADWRSRGW